LQDPILYSGDLRSNLDPLGMHTDVQLWRAIDQAGLRAFVEADSSRLGRAVTDGGANVSAGERQLICLARALLRDARIYIADEATANVDSAADASIQAVLRESLAGRTVILVAHRLHTIMDADRVLVLDGGEVAEYDTPLALLGLAARSEGIPSHKSHRPGTFSALVAGAGAAAASVLVDIATRTRNRRTLQ
jgi:ABC-type multidrug transport system fused ATPase/permease subunit